MKTYPYHTPDGIIELVEKRELDDLASQVADFGVLVDKLERELQDAVKRMEEVPMIELETAFGLNLANKRMEAVRTRLIQAAKGES